MQTPESIPASLQPPPEMPPPNRPLRSSRRWHSGQWKAVSGIMAMVAALAVVWALLATLTVRQRDADLQAAVTELNDLREQVRTIEPHRIGDRTVDDLLDQIISLPGPDSL